MLWVLVISTNLPNDIGCKEKKQALLWGSSLSPCHSSTAIFALPASFLPLLFFLSLAMQTCQALPLGSVTGYSPSMAPLICTFLDHMSYDHMPYVFTLLGRINMPYVWHSHWVLLQISAWVTALERRPHLPSYLLWLGRSYRSLPCAVLRLFMFVLPREQGLCSLSAQHCLLKEF